LALPATKLVSGADPPPAKISSTTTPFRALPRVIFTVNVTIAPTRTCELLADFSIEAKFAGRVVEVAVVPTVFVGVAQRTARDTLEVLRLGPTPSSRRLAEFCTVAKHPSFGLIRHW